MRQKEFSPKYIEYLRVWIVMSRNAMLANFARRFGFFVFLTGKIIRFALYYVFIIYLINKTDTISGYSKNQVLFFFLTFTLIDTVSQFLFRNVYTFKNQVVSGGFDLILSKPINPLFRSLFGGLDFIDFIMIPPLIILMTFLLHKLSPGFVNTAYYLVFLFNGLVVGSAIHIFILSFGIISQSSDYLVLIFRNIESMARFPLDIYNGNIRSFLIFAVPVGIMIWVPTSALFGALSFKNAVIYLVFSIVFFFMSYKFWNYSLKKYSSASS